jgi:hypothetical protein
MELSLRIRADEGLLYATYTGEFSLAAAEKTFLQILEGVEQHNIRKVIVDGSAITGEPSILERFLYGEFVAEKANALRGQTMLSPRFAYILIPPVRDPNRFGENVAFNRGMIVNTFENLDDALEWLELDSSKEE